MTDCLSTVDGCPIPLGVVRDPAPPYRRWTVHWMASFGAVCLPGQTTPKTILERYTSRRTQNPKDLVAGVQRQFFNVLGVCFNHGRSSMIAHMSVVAYVGAEGGEVFILDDLQHVLVKGHKDSCSANGSKTRRTYYLGGTFKASNNVIHFPEPFRCLCDPLRTHDLHEKSKVVPFEGCSSIAIVTVTLGFKMWQVRHGEICGEEVFDDAMY
ncbi:hypothetical protein B0H14DRAFT_2564899 [Mycena olivaceomarginata]|nr:hypothetical protein B0H14DRAFT_2564899 [Mycena olivaceomarginata]